MGDDDPTSDKFGELAVAVDESRRIGAEGLGGENVNRVGVPGSELFLGGGGVPSPDAASVSRNSTQRREKDYDMRVNTVC